MSDYSNQAQFEFSKKLAKFTEQNGTVSEKEEAILFAQSVEMQLLKAPQTAVFPLGYRWSEVLSYTGFQVL